MRNPLLITIPALFLGAPVLTAGAPVLLPLALVVDLIMLRWRLPTVRLLLFFLYYLWLTAAAVTWMGGLWLRAGGFGVRSPASLDRHRRAQSWWVSNIMAAAQPLLNLEVHVDGLELLAEGNAVVLSRHTSTLDALVSFAVVGIQGSKKARYVLKRDLLWEPALNIAGRRLPNHFVDRNARDTAAERDAVGALARNLDDDEVVVIFPEGTFPSVRRRQRALERLEQQPQLHQLGESLTTLLPPRTGGVRQLIANSDGADVIFLGHIGFESCSSIARIWRTIPFRRPVRVKLWRVPAASVPADPQNQALWLFQRWNDLDQWVSAELDD